MKIPRSLLVVLFLSTFAFAQDNATSDEVAQAIENKIRAEDKVSIDNLKVTHKDGTVMLEGVAERYGSRYLAGEIARKHASVKSVQNEIAVRAGDVPDIEIEANLAQKIREEARGTPFDLVAVDVDRGYVRLRGNVRDASLKTKAFEEAIWMRGVRGVENNIQLASVGANDERLRYNLYNRLRREFPQYFVGKFPAILIIVDNARVTLAGQVDSPVSRQKIESIVRSFPGVLTVDNKLEAGN